MATCCRAIVVLVVLGAVPAGDPIRPRANLAPRAGTWSRWLREPRSAVLIVLVLALGLGGSRKWLQGWRARAAIGRLNGPGLTVQAIEQSARHGRAAMFDLFRILGTGETEDLRRAAGRALAVLWAEDDLIAEEEKALVRRGYEVSWRARRRYPRGLRAAIPVSVSYGVPFLEEDGEGVGPGNLEWSHQVLGARRAALESPSPWKAGPGLAEFAMIPEDFDTPGPHRLVLKTKVRTIGLTDGWELELPHVPFPFEFDANLDPESLYALEDEARAEKFAEAVRLESIESDATAPAHFLDLNNDLALRQPPSLVVAVPLACDLAHSVAIEIEGIPGRFPGGVVVLSGQGALPREAATTRRFALGPLGPIPAGQLDRPGPRRLRAILSPVPDLGWADPDVRSIWPGQVETDWIEVQVVRK